MYWWDRRLRTTGHARIGAGLCLARRVHLLSSNGMESGHPLLKQPDHSPVTPGTVCLLQTSPLAGPTEQPLMIPILPPARPRVLVLLPWLLGAVLPLLAGAGPLQAGCIRMASCAPV